MAMAEPIVPDASKTDRQGRYDWLKFRCDRQPDSKDRSCSNLSRIIDDAQYCSIEYEKWDNRWNPLRHFTKISEFDLRAANAKIEYRLKCNG
jgi:hypothetical protein